MTESRLLPAVLAAVLAAAPGAAGAQEPPRGQTEQNGSAVIPEAGEGEVFVLGEDEDGREAAAYEPQDWGRDQYGLYYEAYYWQTADDDFETWYGEAGRDWRDLF